MGTTKASAAKADRLNAAHVQQKLDLVGKIASTMSARGFLPAGPEDRGAWDEYTSALYSNHGETLSRFMIALDLDGKVIDELKAERETLQRGMAAKDAENGKMIDALVAAEREVISQRNSLGKIEDESRAATELIQTLRYQNAKLHRKLEELTEKLQAADARVEDLTAGLEVAAAVPTRSAAEKACSYNEHRVTILDKYKEFWFRLLAVYGHRIPSKGELVTIGVPYDLWSEIMVARQETYDIRTPDHSKKIGCNDCNTGKEYPDAVPIDLYFRNGADGCEAKIDGVEPKTHLVWFYPVIR